MRYLLVNLAGTILKAGFSSNVANLTRVEGQRIFTHADVGQIDDRVLKVVAGVLVRRAGLVQEDIPDIDLSQPIQGEGEPVTLVSIPIS